MLQALLLLHIDHLPFHVLEEISDGSTLYLLLLFLVAAVCLELRDEAKLLAFAAADLTLLVMHVASELLSEELEGLQAVVLVQHAAEV